MLIRLTPNESMASMVHMDDQNPLSVICPTCEAKVGEACVAVSYGFAGRGPKRLMNRTRAPHLERK